MQFDTSRTVRSVIGPIVGLAIEAALLGSIALVLLLGFGILGNPWYQIVKIDGGSMAPTISNGELILVAPPPARVEPGMVVVMVVGDQVVTHRVVNISADGSLVTKGDANHATDDWGGRPVQVVGAYVATVPLLGGFLPVANVSAAAFTDRLGATVRVSVGTFPVPPVAATVEVAPQTINVDASGTMTAIVDSLARPHALGDIDLRSVQLCLTSGCISSRGQAVRGSDGRVIAKFDRSAFAGLVGSHRGSVTLIVQGKLTSGDTFRGAHTNDIIGGEGQASVAGDAPVPAPAPVPTATPRSTPTPTTTPVGSPPPGPSPSPSPSPSAAPAPSVTDAPSPTPVPTTTASPVPTPESTPPNPSPGNAPTAPPPTPPPSEAS